MDRNVAARRDVPMWSETRWNGGWNADQGVGLYLHMGRFRKDLDLWWIQTVAYLPGDELEKDPMIITDRAITIDAQPDRVWPWLVQMGWHRAALAHESGEDRVVAAGKPLVDVADEVGDRVL